MQVINSNNAGCGCGGNCRRHYGFFNFIFDCFMICFTLGFWLVWIFIREHRRGGCC